MCRLCVPDHRTQESSKAFIHYMLTFLKYLSIRLNCESKVSHLPFHVPCLHQLAAKTKSHSAKVFRWKASHSFFLDREKKQEAESCLDTLFTTLELKRGSCKFLSKVHTFWS